MKKIKEVLVFFRRLDKWIYLVIVMTAMVETLESFGILLISATVLNCLAAGEPWEKVLGVIVVMTCGYGLLHFFKIALSRYGELQKQRFYYRYSRFVTEQVLEAPYWQLEKEDFVETVNQVRQNEQVYDLSISILNKAHGIVRTFFSVMVALASFLQLLGTVRSLGEASFLAALLVLVLFLLIVSSTGYIVWRRKKNAESMVRFTEELVKRNKAAMYLLNEVIVRYPVGKHIRLYGMQNRLLQEKQKSINGFADLMSHMNRMEMKPGLAGDVSSVAISGVVYLIVSVAAMWGGLGVGSIIWYAGVVQRLLEAVRQLIQQASELYGDCIRQQVIFRLEEMAAGAEGEAVPGAGADATSNTASDDTANDTAGTDMFSGMSEGSVSGQETLPIPFTGKHVLEFENVSFAYPDSERMVLEHVNLQLSGRQRIALVGQNGSGKSTLIKLICRLYDPSEGRILLDGVDIRKIPRKQYRALLSVVFQDYQIFAASLGENIALGRKQEESGIRKVIGQVGLGITEPDTPLRRDLEEKGVEVSGGEGQKIAIARALYKDAPVVILDEPTASLDPISESEIYEKFNSLVEGKLALFISHRLSSCRFCDRILVLQGGNIVQDGSHEALTAQSGGLYREMWEAQSRYYV